MNMQTTKQRLYLDGCVDLTRGLACLFHQSAAGISYEAAIVPWKKNLPELFDQRKAQKRQREKQPERSRAASGAVGPSAVPGFSSSRDRGRKTERRHVRA